MIQIYFLLKHNLLFGIWINNSGYLITQWQKMVKEQAITWYKKQGRIKKVLKIGKICDKDDILTVQENQVSLFGNNTKRVLEITPCKKKV